jgi:5-methylcytosine-specific restriction endonuclease McrA
VALQRKKPLQQKTPLKAKKQLQAKTGLKQNKPIKRSSKKIAHRSKKMEDKYVDRRKFVKKILSERPFCQACPVFAEHDSKVVFRVNASTDVHELIRRSQGGSILDEENVLAVCRPCHTRIGEYPELSFNLGLAKHSWEK